MEDDIMLESIVMTLVIGVTVIIASFAITQKIFEERRKDNKDAAKLIKDIFEDVPAMVKNIVEASKDSNEVVHDD